MTVKSLALLLYRDLGIVTLTPGSTIINTNQRGPTPGDADAVCLAINGALEEIWDRGPASLCETPLGAVLRPQTAITLNATQFSAAVASVTTWDPWMMGCTVRIPGDPLDNRFLSATKLARPFTGSTGTGLASLVFGDAVQLPQNFSHLLDPVNIPGIVQLGMVGTADEFDRYAAQQLVWTPRTYISYPMQGVVHNKFIGQPCFGFVDTIFDPTVAYVQIFLRVTPMPGQAYPIQFRVRTKPPVVTPKDIDNGDHSADPGILLPVDWIQSVLTPIARKRLSSDALFGNSSGVPEIDRQYKVATAVLDNQQPARIRRQGQYH